MVVAARGEGDSVAGDSGVVDRGAAVTAAADEDKSIQIAKC
jgi:hypothetical protein